MRQSGMTLASFAAALGALTVIVALSVIGWVAVGNLNDRVQGNDDAHTLAAAIAVGQHSSSMAATASVESNATMTRDSVIAARNSIASDKSELYNQLGELEVLGHEARVAGLRERADLLSANVDRIENGRPDLLRALLAGEQNRQKLAKATSRELVPALINSLDNQLYFMMTGRSELRPRVATGAEAFSKEEFLRYDHLSELARSVGIGHSSLLAASSMRDPTIVTNVEEAFNTSAQRAEKSIEFLSEDGGPELDPALIPLSTALFNAGTGQGNYFDTLKVRLSMAVRERELIAENATILAGLQAEIDALVEDVLTGSSARKDDSGGAASTWRIVVLIIGIVGVVGTLLATGYFAFRGRDA